MLAAVLSIVVPALLIVGAVCLYHKRAIHGYCLGILFRRALHRRLPDVVERWRERV